MSSSSRNKQAGFSLMEVLIAMAILVFISLGIYQATVETFRLRDVLSTEGDFYNQIRLSMEILQRDVSAIYSPLLIDPKWDPKKEKKMAEGGFGAPQPLPDPDLQRLLSTNLGQTTPFWIAATDKTGLRASRFVGTESKMTFIAASHLRIYRDAKESDLAKITYELRKDETDKSGNTQVLVKIENTDVFGEEDNFRKNPNVEQVYPLLSGIKSLSFKYLKKDQDQWKDYRNWDSDTQDFKNLFPDMIEVTVSVVGPSKLSFEGTYKMRPEVPLHGLEPKF